jgi:BirA family biotin operon repressor/biotin-[acetyl-CoA-carboxylase] ligase
MNFIKKTHQEIFNALEKYFNDDEKKQIYENFIKIFNQKLYNFEDLERDLKNNGYNFIFFENINSTHLKMLDLINSHHKSENLHRLIILAKSQSSGKGKGSNLWSSDDGGIYLNIAYNFCQTKIPRKYFSQISLITGLVISDILEKNLSYKSNNIQIKWPNDILINEKKICGILPEIILDYLVIGIGINFFPNQNILCDEQRGYISNLVFIEFHKLIFEIIIELNKILYEFFESENFIENFLQTQILPKVEKKLKKQTRFGLISKLLPDGSIDVFDENDNKTIKNFKSALDFENAEKAHL